MSEMKKRFMDRGWSQEDIESGCRVNFLGRESRISVTPRRYIEDRSEWVAKRIWLDELMPDGMQMVVEGTDVTIHSFGSNRPGLYRGDERVYAFDSSPRVERFINQLLDD